MKIGSNATTAPPPRTARARGGQAAAAADSVGVDRPTDTASIMGIPAAELTPKVRAAITALMEEVERLRGELETYRKRTDFLERLADEDALLPVVNRRAFVRELSRTMAFAQRYGSPSSIAYFDVNGMKEVNDNLGHTAGDAVLLHVARTLLDNVRQSDIVGRLGGDEFGVILAQADEEVATMKTMQLAELISREQVVHGGHEVSVSLAFGHYTFEGNEGTHAAIEAADRAMYERKRAAG